MFLNFCICYKVNDRWTSILDYIVFSIFWTSITIRVKVEMVIERTQKEGQLKKVG
jgi:hypothetical protein